MASVACIGTVGRESRRWVGRTTRILLAAGALVGAAALGTGCTGDDGDDPAPAVEGLVPDGFTVVSSSADGASAGPAGSAAAGGDGGGEGEAGDGGGGTTAVAAPGAAYTVTMQASGDRDELADRLDAAARAQGFEQEARNDAEDRTILAYRRPGTDATLTYTLTPDPDGRWTAVAVLLEP